WGDRRHALKRVRQLAEGILNRSAVKQGIGLGHATSSSCGASYTPRRLNAAGAWTSASTRAARVLKGNHSWRSERGYTQGGAARPSLAARCSASAARKTSQRSSPVPGGSLSSKANRVPGGYHRLVLQVLRNEPPPTGLIRPHHQATELFQAQRLVRRAATLAVHDDDVGARDEITSDRYGVSDGRTV